MHIFWSIVVGVIAGWIAGLIVRGSGFGVLGDLIIGAIGAVIGGLAFDALGIATYGTLGFLVMAVIGAVLFLAAIRVLKHA